MKIKALAAAVIMTMSSGIALAENYQFELGANYTDFNVSGVDVGGMTEADVRYYHTSVKTTSLPLAEAAFLGQVSSIGLSALSWEGLDVVTTDIELYIPETMIYVSAVAVFTDFEGVSDDDWLVRIGFTPADGLLVYTSVNEEDYLFNLNAKYVIPVGQNKFLNLETYYADGGDFESSMGVYADYYFTSSFSLGLGYEDVGDDSNPITLRTRKFFTDKISGELSFTDTDLVSALTLGVNVRI